MNIPICSISSFLVIAFFLPNGLRAEPEEGTVKQVVCAVISVDSKPGEDKRASLEFDLTLPKGCSELYWTIEDPPDEHITFSVVEGAPFEDDHLLLENVTDKSTTRVVKAKPDGSLFIAAVKRASKPFKVKVFGRVIEK